MTHVTDAQIAAGANHEPRGSDDLAVALLTGCGDRPYAFGLSMALIAEQISLDIIAGDDLESPEFKGKPGVRFLNLRGSQRTDVSKAAKILRVLKYYWRLLAYVTTTKARVFHILWNNKFETFDRTALMLYYKLLGKQVVLTVHNVNIGLRDGSDSLLNRATLRTQYRLADWLFVHTAKMKDELVKGFGVRPELVSVIPFGINNDVPNTDLTPAEARRRIGLRPDDKAILFFGNIAPYKGLDTLIAAWQDLSAQDPSYRLVIAGNVKIGCQEHWNELQTMLNRTTSPDRILQRIEYIRDDETELYFKAADVLILPYRYIFQSGVLFLGYSFGLPVVATDVGSLRDDIVLGETGFWCRAEDPADLANAITRYFASELFKGLTIRRPHIQAYAHEKHSWTTVGALTRAVYVGLTRSAVPTYGVVDDRPR